MYKIFLLIGLVSCFLLKQHRQNKTYSVKIDRHIEFNKKELANIIAKTWQINN